MQNSIQPIERKTVYGVTFTTLTIDGDSKTGTIWHNSIIDIHPKYFKKDNAQLWERSFDVFAKPTFEQFQEAKNTGNRFWLNTNEVIKELNL